MTNNKSKTSRMLSTTTNINQNTTINTTTQSKNENELTIHEKYKLALRKNENRNKDFKENEKILNIKNINKFGGLSIVKYLEFSGNTNK